MNSWQITAPMQIGKYYTTENLEKIDEVKVKITKCFISSKDVSIFSGAYKTDYPVIPGHIAVGQVVETLKESDYLRKGSKVYLAPIEEEGYHEGYLRDFAVVPQSSLRVLPKTVSESDALYLTHLSLALTTIDKLNIDKGEHVAILGANVLGNIIAQLIMYYQGVPIVIDDNEEYLDIAHKTNVYYTLKNDKNIEREIISITGGRKCSKVIYITGSDINIDIIDKLTCHGAHVGITGIAVTKTKLTANIAFEKELNVTFIKNGTSNLETGINLIAQKVIDLSYFKLPSYKFEYANKHFENAVEKIKGGAKLAEFLIDLM
ncbi:MAG: alcohol dehydrogenase catalytic domain-containing protein [Clostridia bacterium]|nr:alcohol dehydrogenase catalytic domain-containing protein [Clostridia bacterium]